MMARIVKLPLTENELEFMELWKTAVLPNKYRIDIGVVNRAAALLAYRRTGTCSSCNRNDVIDLNNQYNMLLDQYNRYLAEVQKQIDDKEAERIRKIVTTKKKIEENETKQSTKSTSKKIHGTKVEKNNPDVIE